MGTTRVIVSIAILSALGFLSHRVHAVALPLSPEPLVVPGAYAQIVTVRFDTRGTASLQPGSGTNAIPVVLPAFGLSFVPWTGGAEPPNVLELGANRLKMCLFSAGGNIYYLGQVQDAGCLSALDNRQAVPTHILTKNEILLATEEQLKAAKTDLINSYMAALNSKIKEECVTRFQDAELAEKLKGLLGAHYQQELDGLKQKIDALEWQIQALRK